MAKRRKDPELIALRAGVKERHADTRTVHRRMKEQQAEWDAERAIVHEVVMRRCELAREYAEAHPQYAELDASDVRRAANAGVPFIPNLSRLEIVERDNLICEMCGQQIDVRKAFPDPEAASFDHIIPLREGGPHVPDNIRTIHTLCGGRQRIFKARAALLAKKERELAESLSS